MAQAPRTFSRSRAVTVIAALLVLGFLYFARQVLIPIALAFLLSFLLAPLVRRIQVLRIGRVTSALVVVAMAVAVVAGVGLVVAAQMVDLANSLTEYRDNIQAKVSTIQASPASVLGRASRTIRQLDREISQSAGEARAEAQAAASATDVEPPVEPMPVRVVADPPDSLTLLRSAFGPVMPVITNGAIVVVLLIFMLIERESLRDRLLRLTGQDQLHTTTQALDEAGRRVTRYLLMQSMVNGTTGLVVATGLWFIGVPNALLWGLLSAVLRFIPYIGPWMSSLMPVAVSFAVSPGWIQPILTAGMFIAIELISNNFIEPWLYGSGTGVSPMGLIAAAIFWTWLWGPVGLVLATPLTVCLVVIGRYVPQLELFSILFGDQPTLRPEARLYQRLLAMDSVEAAGLVDERRRSGGGLVKLYDDLLLPALALAERDREEGDVESERLRFIYEHLAELARVPGTAPALRRAPGSQVQVLSIPAGDEADQIAGTMLARALAEIGRSSILLTLRDTARDLHGRIDLHRPKVVVISAQPPADERQLATLCERLKSHQPDLPVVVGLWTTSAATAPRTQSVLKSAGADAVVGSLAEALELIGRYSVPRPSEDGGEAEDLDATSTSLTAFPLASAS